MAVYGCVRALVVVVVAVTVAVRDAWPTFRIEAGVKLARSLTLARQPGGLGRASMPGLKPGTAGAILTRRARSDLRPCTWG